MSSKASTNGDGRHLPCPCGSGKPFEACDPRAGLAACVECGRPFHPGSNAAKWCGSARSGTGCAGERRRKLEARRKRRARRRAVAAGAPLT